MKLGMNSCPKCGYKMERIQGLYPWKCWYLVCLNCKYSEILDNPSIRNHNQREEKDENI